MDKISLEIKRYFLTSVTWMTVISLFYALLMSRSPGGFLTLFFASFVVSQTTCFFCTWGEFFLFRYVKFWRNFWIQKKESYRPLGSFVFVPFGLSIGYYLVREFFAQTGIDFFYYHPSFTKGPSLTAYLLAFISISLIIYIRRFLHSKEQEKNLQLKVKALEIESLKSKLTALTLQMNPHFLFNILHTVTSYIREDQDKAEDLMTEFSDLLRLVLEASEKESHTLEDELEIASAYLSLEKSRFGERLSYNFEEIKDFSLAQKKIPVLILQPLFENSIKHGLSQGNNSLEIKLEYASKDHCVLICIKDNGFNFDSKHKGNSIGLKNCRKRLSLMFGEQASLVLKREDAWTHVTVSLPKEKSKDIS